LRPQWRYALEEAELIERGPWTTFSLSSRARKLLFVAALAAFVLAYFWRGGVRDGWPGLIYASERAIAELLITVALVERRFKLTEQYG
jgi:hypothetical protein